ncbi:hypothetical protein [Streptomyces osmaniensis]|uniref:Uncharacterized protein n=1 Tax=Streptomyces osmaniensis TaxID=593134 RepID=A0ABP6VPC9_9ACTN
MDFNRRTAMAAGLGTAATVAAGLGTAATVAAGLGTAATVAVGSGSASVRATGPATITIPGESPSSTNIPVARDRRASGGRYLALLTAERPPSDKGWYATYRVRVPKSGVYTLTAVAVAPMETPHTEAVGSYLQLSVDGGPFREVARSQPDWYGSPAAWGDLSEMNLGELELREGDGAFSLRVVEPTVLDNRIVYVLSLDHLVLRPLPGGPALRAAAVPRHRVGEPARLRLTLNARATRPHPVHYAVTDYDGQRVAAGRAAVPAGRRTTTVTLPADLSPGHYRIHADDDVTSTFARLPVRRAVTRTGTADNPFGVNVWASSLVPPSGLDEFAATLRDMGAGWVRDGQSWPAAEPAPGAYDTAHHDRVTRTLRAHGLAVLDVLSPAPEWAMTDASLPLPADLRHAYRYARRLALARPEALQLSNEPDVDTTRSTGDAHAAFVKATALGIKDACAEPPLVVLPGIAQSGPFQDLMLANDVVRYADVWPSTAIRTRRTRTTPRAAHFVGTVSQLPTGVRGFRFDDGCGHQVSVLWAAARHTRVSLPGVAYDIMGRRIERSGKAVVVSPDPVYVVSREAASIARDRGAADALRRPDPGSLSPRRAHRPEPALRRPQCRARQGRRRRATAARLPPGPSYPDEPRRLQLRRSGAVRDRRGGVDGRGVVGAAGERGRHAGVGARRRAGRGGVLGRGGTVRAPEGRPAAGVRGAARRRG